MRTTYRYQKPRSTYCYDVRHQSLPINFIWTAYLSDPCRISPSVVCLSPERCSVVVVETVLGVAQVGVLLFRPPLLSLRFWVLKFPSLFFKASRILTSLIAISDVELRYGADIRVRWEFQFWKLELFFADGCFATEISAPNLGAFRHQLWSDFQLF